MEEIPGIHLRRLQGRLGELVYEFTRLQFRSWSGPETWQPALNAYRCREQIVICVDLAGVDKQAVDLRVEPGRLSLRGRREAPEPNGKQPKAEQILAMEIDYGPFERQLELPAAVDTERIRAEQNNGLLWIYLPLASES